jgi:hypothetical protein
MNNLLRLAPWVVFIVLSFHAAEGQSQTSSGEKPTPTPSVNISKSNEPPSTTTLRRVGETSGLTTRFEFWLSLEVLIFGTIVIVLQHFQMRGRAITSQDGLRVYAITLILVGALFIITAGFDSSQIAPAMGLFGTIAGYLLGRVDSKTANRGEEQ